MKKKLIKYGNSHALLIDRTLMGLLNIGPQGVVNLRVEGERLIITAEKMLSDRDLFTMDVENTCYPAFESKEGGMSTLAGAIENKIDNFLLKVDEDPKLLQGYSRYAQGTEGGQNLQKAFAHIFEKYKDEIEKLNACPKYTREVEGLMKEYKDNPSEELFQEIRALQIKYAPHLASLIEEISQVQVPF